MMWLIILGLILILSIYLYGIKPFNYWKEKCIPYIKPLPFLGNIGSNLLGKKALGDLLQDFYYKYPKERYVGIFQFVTPTLILRDPELIKRITVKEFDTFPQHRPFVPDNVDPYWDKNLFAMKGGEKWHDMRSTLSPSFTSSKMKIMFNLIKDCTKQFTNYYLKQGGTVTVEMKDAFTKFTNDVIATTAFGVTCNSLKNPENQFYLTGKKVTNFSGFNNLKFFLGTLSPSLMKVLRIGILSKPVTAFFGAVIKETLRIREEKKIIRPDMVHLLMEAKKGGNKNDNSKIVDTGFAVVQESDITGNGPTKRKIEITDEDVIAQALIFFLAGFDTASTFMCFTAHELAVNPEIQEKLHNEIDQSYNECKGDLTYEAVLGMKYLDMVVSESLRKWPPVTNMDRMSVKTFTIEPEQPGEKPLTLEKGSVVWVPIYSLHRDPQYYPNPDIFDPTRFSEENKKNIRSFTYVPFGSGPKNCIGSRFALLEGKLVLAEILSKFEIVPVAQTQIPLKLHKHNFTTLAEKGFWLGLKPREKKIPCC